MKALLASILFLSYIALWWARPTKKEQLRDHKIRRDLIRALEEGRLADKF